MTTYPDIALLALRIGLGIIFIAHGWQKIKNPAAWAKMMNLPLIIGFLVAVGEFFGGLGILFGLLTQIAALGPLLVMLGALYYHIFKWGQPFVTVEGKGYEFPFMLLLVALALALLGGGAYSLDAIIFH